MSYFPQISNACIASSKSGAPRFLVMFYGVRAVEGDVNIVEEPKAVLIGAFPGK